MQINYLYDQNKLFFPIMKELLMKNLYNRIIPETHLDSAFLIGKICDYVENLIENYSKFIIYFLFEY